MRCVSEKEAELSSLKQAAELKEFSLKKETERSSKELGHLHEELKKKVGWA